jgi:tRNA pseudouridine(55) synthase
MPISIYKNRFETPLEALEKARIKNGIASGTPMTYAGRLDPMAVGQMIILTGEECKNREEYLGRDKAYKLEILFGIGTDTQDVFGVINNEIKKFTEEESVACMIAGKSEINSLMGTHTFAYPKYSTKGIIYKNNKSDDISNANEFPEREMTVTSIQCDGGKMVTGEQAKSLVKEACEKIKGDFRYEEIQESWEKVEDSVEYPILKFHIECASGTYMRTIAEELGKRLGIPALAYYIERTRT